MRCTNTWCLTARSTKVPHAFPAWQRGAFIVSSFGKTYHVTGWKVGTWQRLPR